jgi:hypothetical protein
MQRIDTQEDAYNKDVACCSFLGYTRLSAVGSKPVFGRLVLIPPLELTPKRRVCETHLRQWPTSHIMLVQIELYVTIHPIMPHPRVLKCWSQYSEVDQSEYISEHTLSCWRQMSLYIKSSEMPEITWTKWIGGLFQDYFERSCFFVGYRVTFALILTWFSFLKLWTLIWLEGLNGNSGLNMRYNQRQSTLWIQRSLAINHHSRNIFSPWLRLWMFKLGPPTLMWNIKQATFLEICRQISSFMTYIWAPVTLNYPWQRNFSIL